jgi:hypothetical protein
MRIAEFVAAGVFLAMGVRSLVHWVRRPFESADPRDHLLFAAFVVGRAGMWLSLAGSLVLSATLKDPNGSGAYLRGRAFADYFRDRYWWYPLTFTVFLVMQFLAGWFLGHRRAAHDPS